MLAKYDEGQISDLLNYLSEPWAKLLYHDEFPRLRMSLLENALKFVAVGGKSTQTVEATICGQAQDNVLSFIKQHGAAECPGYVVPATA